MPKIKNILIFVAIAVVLVLGYVFFVRSSAPAENLISSTGSGNLPAVSGSGMEASAVGENNLITKDFLTLLLNVKNIKLDDSIFSDPSFNNLHDSSITLVPDGTEGRVNPFAPFGSDKIVVPIENIAPITPTTTTTTPATQTSTNP